VPLATLRAARGLLADHRLGRGCVSKQLQISAAILNKGDDYEARNLPEPYAAR
jgi:hypothetical protein